MRRIGVIIFVDNCFVRGGWGEALWKFVHLVDPLFTPAHSLETYLATEEFHKHDVVPRRHRPRLEPPY
jgi:hypothetical protein